MSQARMVETIIPILSVRDLSRSFQFYVAALGFKKDWQTQGVGSVSRDGCAIMLAEEHKAAIARMAVWIGVEDVEAMYANCQAAGASSLMEPTNYDWACEMRVADPDGHVLRIGGAPQQG